jgi:hypothetical protein
VLVAQVAVNGGVVAVAVVEAAVADDDVVDYLLLTKGDITGQARYMMDEFGGIECPDGKDKDTFVSELVEKAMEIYDSDEVCLRQSDDDVYEMNAAIGDTLKAAAQQLGA